MRSTFGAALLRDVVGTLAAHGVLDLRALDLGDIPASPRTHDLADAVSALMTNRSCSLPR